ncbi:MAG: autotransporter-associated beta strand repeat-containing protein, partial [Burkholderia sp.]|nr:autotransporter-associated beta strand repeat-containing protein [Burkholderia sp.]
GDVVDASTFDLTAAATLNLNNGTTSLDRTVGTLIFGDTNASNATTFNWTVAANGGAGSNPKLILDGGSTTPTIQVNNGTTTITAVVAGSQGFIKTGAGTLVLANAGDLITGGINLNAGALSFSTGALNNNTITVTGNTTLNWNNAGDVTDLSSKIILGNGFTLTLGLSGGATDNTVFASTIATSGGNGGGIVKSNAGILTITAQQVYTGGTKVNNGRLVLTGGNDRLATTGTITLGNGANSGVVQLGDITGASNQTIAGLTVSGTGTANGFVGGNATISILTINNAANIAAASSPILGGAGTNENNLALVKSGAGSLSLAKNNTFVGDVTLIGGNLTVTNNGSLGVGPKTVTISGTVNAPSLQ